MAAPRNSKQNADTPSSIGGFSVVSSNGIAPESRVPNANIAFNICYQLLLDNARRENKWSRIYKCYKRFPPTDYSLVAKKGLTHLSNVNFGQMEFIVDNQKGSFYDLVTERNLAANITTKYGTPRERKKYSDLISTAFDRSLREWQSYLYNVEQDTEEMCLFGKGLELAEERSGWPTKSFHNSDILVPDGTFADLSNLGELVIKRSYTPLELWLKVTGGEPDEKKAEAHATELGWNFWAVVDALRLWTTTYQNRYTNSQWLRDVASGSVNLSRLYSQRILAYEMYVKEYDTSISKCMVLQNYGPIMTNYRENGKGAFRDFTEEKYRDQIGFLFYQKDWVKASRGDQADTDNGGWSEIISPITDSVGSGLWHEIKGLAERVYVQCRQYDINMNRVVDAMNLQMMLMLKGGSAESTKKLKQMEWLPWMILPQDVEPSQVRLQLPFGDILNGIQFYQQDMYRGIGAYRINERGANGGTQTATQANLDAAESAKLQGTQIKRFNECQGRWQRQLYKRLVNTKSGGEGYGIKRKFEDFLSENGVPKDAWKWEAIERMESNMLNGAGSPSFKLMAAQQTVGLAAMVAANEGQEAAIQDAIAALQGRQNVKRYRPDKKVDIPDEARVIAFENAAMTDPATNVENVRVFPNDNHIEHFKGHFSDAMLSCDKAEMGIQEGQMSMEDLGKTVQSLMALKGPHMVAHLDFIRKDESKKDMTKTFEQSLNMLQRRVDMLANNYQQMAEAKAKAEPKPGNPEEVKLQALVATEAIKVDSLKKKEDIKLASKAQTHEQKMQQSQDKAATSLATTRAKAQTSNEIAIQKARIDEATKIATTNNDTTE